MIVRYTGKSDSMSLIHNKHYEVLSIEFGWYRVIDETDEDYLYPPELFEIVSKDVMPNIIGSRAE